MRPSFHPEGWNNVSVNIEKETSMETQPWTINGRCPKNSIPIIRTRREDIIRAKSIERYGKKDFHIHQPQQANRNINHEVYINKILKFFIFYIDIHFFFFLNVCDYTACSNYSEREISWCQSTSKCMEAFRTNYKRV